MLKAEQKRKLGGERGAVNAKALRQERMSLEEIERKLAWQLLSLEEYYRMWLELY